MTKNTKKHVNADVDLAAVMTAASIDDLDILVDNLTDRGVGRVAMSSSAAKALTRSKAARIYTPSVRETIASEICQFGGNTIKNMIRGSGAPYREIAVDVAKKVKAKHGANATIEDIEMAILAQLVRNALPKLSEEEKKNLFAEFGASYTTGAASMAALQLLITSTGMASHKLSAVVANSMMMALIGRGLTFGATASMMRGIGAFVGPIGWSVTAIWTAFDLSSPAYRVTVPCVVQIAYMRQKALQADLRNCPACGASAAPGAKFCGECGSPLAQPLVATEQAKGGPVSS